MTLAYILQLHISHPNFIQTWSSLLKLCAIPPATLSPMLYSASMSWICYQLNSKKSNTKSSMTCPTLHCSCNKASMIYSAILQIRPMASHQQGDHTASEKPSYLSKTASTMHQPECPAPIGYMIATCWHDGGDDPGRKKRYQEKQKLKQTARANMAMTETWWNRPCQIHQMMPLILMHLNILKTVKTNKNIFLSYLQHPMGQYSLSQTLSSTWKMTPKPTILSLKSSKPS